MKTFLFQDVTPKEKLPSHFIDDGRMDPKLLERIIDNYSRKHDVILDPFMGYGTLVGVCNAKERNFIGVEIDKSKCDYVKNTMDIKNCTIINSNIMNVDPTLFPPVDLVITSPTYSWKNVGKNPFNDNSGKNYYKEYLCYIEMYFRKISTFLKKGGYLLLEVSNVEWDDVITNLAWDISNSLRKIDDLKQKKEIVVNWLNDKEGFGGGTYGFGYDHSYLLVFERI